MDKKKKRLNRVNRQLPNTLSDLLDNMKPRQVQEECVAVR